jgi:hypothetical protein
MRFSSSEVATESTTANHIGSIVINEPFQNLERVHSNFMQFEALWDAGAKCAWFPGSGVGWRY